MALAITVAGVTQTTRLRNNSTVRGSFTLGARATASFQFKDDTESSGAYRVPLDAAIVFSDGATTLFGGKVQEVIDTPLGEPNFGVVSQVSVTDWTGLTDQAFILTRTYASGQSLKTIVQALVTSDLAALGVTLDAGMLTGPTMGLIEVNNMYASGVLNYLSTLSGWVWYIDASKVLHMFAVGTVTGTGLSPSNTRSMKWRRSRDSYVNDVTLIYGPSTMLNKTQFFAGDGTTTQWLLDYSPALDANNAILSQGYVTDTAYGGNAPLGIYPAGGYLWTYDYTTRLLHRSSALPAGQTASLIYGVQFPQSVNVTSSTEITANGRYAASFTDTTITDKSAAVNAANAILRKSILTPKRATVVTSTGPWTPGMSVTMSFSSRTVTGSYMITEAEWETESDGLIVWTLQLLEGSEAQETWLDFFRNAFGGSSSSTTGVASGGSGTYTPIISAVSRPWYGLAVNKNEWVSTSSAGSWTSISGIQIYIDTVARGNASATVRVRLRAADAGVGVKARLWNVEDGVAAGTGNLVTSTTFVEDTFAVAFATGTKHYELQLQPTVANADVNAVGSME